QEAGKYRAGLRGDANTAILRHSPGWHQPCSLLLRPMTEADMLKKILLALDGSENAERALPWIKQYAGPQKAQVVLFRAVDTEHLEKGFIPSEMRSAGDYLPRISKDLNYAGIPTKMVVDEGKPAPAIVGTAIEENCELILMTTRGGS